jgi:hypothetical protein
LFFEDKHFAYISFKTGQTSSMLNQFCLRMRTELVPETLYLNELTRLCAREDYIETFYIL